jgi:excisionase family DNA binding protein
VSAPAPELQQYTIAEVADLLGYSRRTVYNLIYQGELGIIKNAEGRGAVRIPATEIVGYQKRHFLRTKRTVAAMKRTAKKKPAAAKKKPPAVKTAQPSARTAAKK